MRLVARDLILRGLPVGDLRIVGQWGVFVDLLLFANGELGLDAAVSVAALGGFGSLIGALVADRATRRFKFGRLVVGSLLLAALGNLLIPLAPAGLPVIAIACLIGQQLHRHRRHRVRRHGGVDAPVARRGSPAGRVNATVRVVMVLATLVGTVVGGLIGEAVGLRAAAFLAPLFALIGAIGLYLSPVWQVGRPTPPVAAG